MSDFKVIDLTRLERFRIRLTSLVRSLLAGKVDREPGKGLSTNDYSDADRAKLSGIVVGSEFSGFDNTEKDGDTLTFNLKGVRVGSAAELDAGYESGQISVLGESLQAGRLLFVRSDMRVGSMNIPMASPSQDGMMSTDDFSKLSSVVVGTEFSGFDSTEKDGEILSFNLKAVNVCPVLSLTAGTGLTQAQMDAMGVTAVVWDDFLNGAIGRIRTAGQGVMQVTRALGNAVAFRSSDVHGGHSCEYFVEKTGAGYNVYYSES